MEGPTALAQFRSCPPVAISVSAVHSHALLSTMPTMLMPSCRRVSYRPDLLTVCRTPRN
ncbi:hypothetical protein GCG54_00014797 [Colletotrichum gloeosporioides]|uniref:Uncharacterized protein n=1 Tax=Colletotrichum gloeosporioides TaxID=474922 RepID=A0A8H4CCR4_COLGL|nr:uncharacterized protein GCG54_00014797 [Colletotrichum gloeosporioides]KAF3801581.1 hypothetical protein GCG54_00014797 [Colletotrichum gloeosporioides]